MKVKFIHSIIGIAICLGLCVTTARANPSTYELGYVVPGSPASPSDETSYLSISVGGYNNGYNPGVIPTSFTGDPSHTYTLDAGSYVPAAPLPGVGTELVNQGNSGGTASITVAVAAGADYALVKWGDTSELYYIGGLTGTVILDNDVNENGESHYDEWAGSTTSVPDGGSTVILLGIAMLGLVAVSPRLRKVSIN